ncbi:hypothetical protein [Desulfovibrio legallii]|jgi:hypothetical protein|uniref:Uncharacterized protein n=1 Tax=Desulfovibrio legallii TaxID=571438 RepID=A0A6H3F900_9BACT|nr:hypothetical protein [Desulfovibrio legallii]TBH78168.1 hypothetical protein EB812_11515 [Desulfovibrio legallii]
MKKIIEASWPVGNRPRPGDNVVARFRRQTGGLTPKMRTLAQGKTAQWLRHGKTCKNSAPPRG